MPIKQPRLADVPVATAQGVTPPDQSAGTLVKGLGILAEAGASALGAASARGEAASKEEVISAFEDTLLTDSFSQLSASEQAEKEIEADGMQLTNADKKALGDASAQASSIDRLEAQSGQADRAKLGRANVFRQFKTAFPHLAPEFRKFFKQQTGEAVVESLRGIEEERQKTAAESRKDYDNNLTKHVEALGFVSAGMSIAEKQNVLSPYQDQLVAAAAAAREAKFLRDNKTIRTEERRVIEEAIAESGATGSLLNNQIAINSLLQDFDFETADTETKTAMIRELQMRKSAFEAGVNDTFQVMDTARRDAIKGPTLASYDQAIAVVNGELDKAVMTTNNAITREGAMLQLNKIAGYPELLARLQTFKNIPPELIVGGQRTRFSIDMVHPMLEMLAVSMDNPNGNPYGSLELGTPEQVAGQYRSLAKVALGELENSEAAQNLANVLQAWTNEFTRAPEEVPLDVFDAMLDVSSEPGVMNVLEKSDPLADNLVIGYRAFTSRMRAGLAEDLAEVQGENVPIFKKGQVSPVKAGFLGFIAEDYAEGFKQPIATPRLFEVVDVQLKSNGDITFTADPRLKGNPQVATKANQMTKAYGKTFGKLVRSYAHTVNKNTDYVVAAQTLMSFPDWQEAMSEVKGTGFVVEGEE